MRIPFVALCTSVCVLVPLSHWMNHTDATHVPAIASVTDGDSARCTTIPQLRWPVGDYVYFVGSATGRRETVGAGEYTLMPLPGETPANVGRDIEGDVIAVEQQTRSKPARLHTNAKEIVVVLWGYGADCKLVRRTGQKFDDMMAFMRTSEELKAHLPPSSHTLAAGDRRLYHGFLRPLELWYGDVPVVDMLPYYGPGGSLAGVRELFAKVDSLPGDSAIRADPVGALRAVREWGNIRGLDSLRYDEIATAVYHAAQDALASRMRPAMAGTYRLSMVGPDLSDTITTFMRVASEPSGAERTLTRQPVAVAQIGVATFDKLKIRAVVANSESLLLREPRGGGFFARLFGRSSVARDRDMEGSLVIAAHADSGENSMRSWRASLDLFVAFAKPADSAEAHRLAFDKQFGKLGLSRTNQDFVDKPHSHRGPFCYLSRVPFTLWQIA